MRNSLLANDVTKNVPNFISSCGTNDTKTRPQNWEVTKGKGTDFIEAGTDHQGDEVLWTSKDGQFNSGFHIARDDELMVNMEIVSYNKEKKDFYLTYEIEYIPGLVGSNAQGQLLNIIACEETTKKVDTSMDGPTNTTGGKHLIYKDGTIIDASKWSPNESC
jgi:hypothetical protein